MQASRNDISDQNHKNIYNGHGNGCNGHSDEDEGQKDNLHKKPLQIVGLAKKAGFLAVGSDAVQTAIDAGKAELIVFASDTSEGTIRRVSYAAKQLGVADINVPYTKFEFSRIAGRGSPGTLAILDLGLAKELLKRLSALDKAYYGEIVRLLEAKALTQKADKASKPSRARNATQTRNKDKAKKRDRTAKMNQADRAGRPDNRRAKV